jgi:hypothetical protein
MIYSETLLITAVGYEQSKRLVAEHRNALWKLIEARVVAFAEAHDSRHNNQIECTGDILCERIGVRHKADCQGRTVDISTYVRGLQL